MRTKTYKGLLRPAMVLGVPIPVLVMEIGFFSLTIIMEETIWLLYLPITHAALWLVTLYDPYLLSNIVLWISLTRTRNKRFWGMNSYAP